MAYRARHAVFGAMIGDALGSTVEFLNTDKAKAIIKKYDKMSF